MASIQAKKNRRWPPKRYWMLCLELATRTSMPASSIRRSSSLVSKGMADLATSSMGVAPWMPTLASWVSPHDSRAARSQEAGSAARARSGRCGIGVRSQQGRKARRIAAGHAAFGSDAVHARVAPGGRKPCRISRAIVVMDETQIELRFRTRHQLSERRKIGIIRAPLGHRQVEELNRPVHAGEDGVRHLDHEKGILGLDEVFVSRAAVAKVIA